MTFRQSGREQRFEDIFTAQCSTRKTSKKTQKFTRTAYLILQSSEKLLVVEDYVAKLSSVIKDLPGTRSTVSSIRYSTNEVHVTKIHI